MNKTLLRQGMALIACLLMMQTAITKAQTLVTPMKHDIPWYTPCTLGAPGYIAGLNTSMIELLNWGLNGTNTTLMVSDYYGNGTPGGVVFTDQSSGFQIQWCYHATGTPLALYYIDASPDITVGNFYSAPANNKVIVAVAYINVDLPTGVRTPMIDYFLVTYTGFGIFTVNHAGHTDITGDAEPNAIHIDIAAEATNTTTTGLPWCNAFIVTWDDIGTGAVYANIGFLNGPPPGTFAEPLSQMITNSGSFPDVAAIQRDVPPTCVTCLPTLDYFGLFTYMDGGNLYEAEWDASLPIPSGVVPNLLDFVGFPDYFVYPRIDAVDDHTLNGPVPARADWEVVVEKHQGGTIYSNSYDIFNIPFGYDNNPFLVGTTYSGYAPTVAFGPNGNTQYAIAHSSDQPAIGPTWNTYMEPIDWTTGTIATVPGYDYYLVNLNTFPATGFVNGNYLTAISTPCNNTSLETLVAWSIYDKVTQLSQVYYKTTPFPYAFKHDNTAGITNPEVTEWKIYPDPATTQLTVDVPAKDGARYEVADMAGRTVLNGTLPGGTTSVDVSRLALGCYIVDLYEGDKRSYITKFVKQ